MFHRRLYKTLLVVMALAFVLAGRGLTATKAQSSLSGTITVLSHRTDLDKDGTLAKYSAEFKKLYPNVTVNWETITYYAGEVTTRLNTKDSGDVLNIPPTLSADKFSNFFTVLGTVDGLGKKYNFVNNG